MHAHMHIFLYASYLQVIRETPWVYAIMGIHYGVSMVLLTKVA